MTTNLKKEDKIVNSKSDEIFLWIIFLIAAISMVVGSIALLKHVNEQNNKEWELTVKKYKEESKVPTVTKFEGSKFIVQFNGYETPEIVSEYMLSNKLILVNVVINNKYENKLYIVEQKHE
jgi:hypothetical protein